MSRDLRCPHCEAEFIYELVCDLPKANAIHEEECPNCGKKFKWEWYLIPEFEVIEEEE